MTQMTAQQEKAGIAEHITTAPAIPLQDERAVYAPEQQYRAGAYSLLAALLREVPTQDTLDRAAGLNSVESEEDELATSMAMLGLAAQRADRDAVDDEYHTLFIGLGRGEIVPYGSWYLTGFLMEKPLGLLRADLMELGFERDPDVKEPEDHVAALCEVMALLIQDNSTISTQSQFFTKHMSKWLGRFFDDLARSKSASFYQAVARFGSAFIAFERQYYGLEIQEID